MLHLTLAWLINKSCVISNNGVGVGVGVGVVVHGVGVSVSLSLGVVDI